MSGSHHGDVHRDDAANRAVIISAVALGFAAAVELGSAVLSGSAGVLADGLHNLGDVLTTAVLLAAFRIARRPATHRFTSGFGRIEDVATLLIILVIVVTAALATVVSIQKFITPTSYRAVPLSLLAAAIGVVANLSVAEYKVRVGRRLRSTPLEADGVHSRIDALVSAGAFVGIGLAAFGARPADPIAGLVITAAILYILAGSVRQLVLRMMDAVDPGVVDAIVAAASAVPGVLGVHDVRARWVGRELAAVVHLDCAPDITLQVAHQIAVEVEHAIAHQLPEARIDVHMDPGTDAHQHGQVHHHHAVAEAPEGD